MVTFTDTRSTPVSRIDRYLGRSPRRAADPVRVVLIATLIGALGLGAGYFALDRLADRSTAIAFVVEPASTQHPVLSARRAPETLSFVSRTGQLRRALDQVGQSVPANGCLRVDWLGETITSLRPGIGLVPASASKVITAAVALEVLGPEHTFETSIYAESSGAGSSTRALYVVGDGDPVLVNRQYVASEKYPTRQGTSVENLVQSIVDSGITSVTEAIYVLDGKYDDVRYVDSWPTSFHGVEAGPLGALMINDSSVTGEALKRDDPAVAAGAQLQMELSARGLSMTTNIQRAAAVPPTASKVASITSQPLSTLLVDMLVNSDNNTAELLVKELGHARSGVGTTEAGLQVIADTLAGWGLTEGVTIVDGSGLSRGNIATCDAMMAILNRFAGNLTDSLAVAGRTGTLRDVFLDTRVEDRMRAKTGTLNGVKSLVGYLPLDEETDVSFALMMNASGIDNQNSYRPVWNSLADALARAREVPRADQLLP